MDINYDVIALFQDTVILRKPGVPIFADIIELASFLLKQSFKTQEKVK